MSMTTSATIVVAVECATIAFWDSVIIALVKGKSGVKAASVPVAVRAVMEWEENCATWWAAIING